MKSHGILSAFMRFSAVIKDNITITLENAAIARRIYSLLKELFNIQPKIIIRNQKRFRVKQIYILEVNEKIDYILKFLNIMEDKKKVELFVRRCQLQFLNRTVIMIMDKK